MYDISPSDFAHHVRQATSWKDLAVRCGCPLNQNCCVFTFHLRHLHQKIENMRLNTDHISPKPPEVPDDVFIQIVKDSTCLTQVQTKCKAMKGQNYWNPDYCKTRIKYLCINIDHFKMRKKFTTSKKSKKMNAIDDETFQTILHNSRSWADLFRNCGFIVGNSPCTKNIILDRINRLGLNTKHFESKTIANDKIFVAESRYYHSDSIKKKLLCDFNWRYECNACKNIHFVEQDGVLTWMNKPVELQLDHINGLHDDNRIENLQFLCGLCHSQTSTYCGANHKKHKAIQKWLEDGKTSYAPGSIESLLN